MTDVEAPNPFQVMCFNDHIFQVQPGTELERKCQEKADQGAVSAMVIPADECPECIDANLMQEADMFAMLGCPSADLDGNCQHEGDCMGAPSPDSPYQDQLIYVGVVDMSPLFD